MGRSPVWRWLAFAVCFAAAYGGFKWWRVHRELESAQVVAREADDARDQPPPAADVPAGSADQPLGEFTLTDQRGEPFHSSSLAGQVWVGSFFFTNCPAVCWRQNQALAAIQELNPTSQVKFVSISCDPENDTPEVLTRYAERFHADPQRWVFLTGNMQEIVQIGKQMFKVSVERGTHSDRAFVVDRDGKVQGRFRVTEPDQLEKLKLLLAKLDTEPAPPAEAK